MSSYLNGCFCPFGYSGMFLFINHFNFKISIMQKNKLSKPAIFVAAILLATTISSFTLLYKKIVEQATNRTMPTGKIASLKYIYLSFDDGPLNGSENIDSVCLLSG